MDPGRYSKIYRRMWNDSKFRKLSRPQPCGQSLWVRLLCGPELGPIPGLFSAREEGLASSLGWPLKPFRESFEELFRAGLAKADWDAGLVWVNNAILYNEPANPNVVKSWTDVWAELPECDLKSEAHSRICAYLETRGEPFASTFRNHCPNHSPNRCRNQEQEQEQEQEQDSVCAETAEPSSPPVLVFPCDGDPREWSLTESQVEAWRQAFPAQDVLAEARKALAWVMASPDRRKTAKGMGRFLVGWLGRSQDRGAGSRQLAIPRSNHDPSRGHYACPKASEVTVVPGRKSI